MKQSLSYLHYADELRRISAPNPLRYKLLELYYELTLKWAKTIRDAKVQALLAEIEELESNNHET